MHNDNIFLKNLTKRNNLQICKISIGGTEFLITEEQFEEVNLVSIFLLEKEKFLEHFFATQLVVENDRFYVDRIFFDTLGHTDRVTYFLEKNHVVREVSNYSAKKQPKKYPILLPVYFFESIKAENLDEAKSYLCKELQQVDDNYFFDYFLNFSHLVFENEKYFLLGYGGRKELKFETEGDIIFNFEIS